MDVQQVFTGYDSLNQAINSKFLGPLFKKGVMGSSMYLLWDWVWDLYEMHAPQGRATWCMVNELFVIVVCLRTLCTLRFVVSSR